MKSTKFTTKLRIWRASRTQREAAKSLGLNLATYKNWEYGRNQPTTYAMNVVRERIDKPGPV